MLEILFKVELEPSGVLDVQIEELVFGVVNYRVAL